MAPKLTAPLLEGGEVEELPLDVLEAVVVFDEELLDELDAEVVVLAADDADEAMEETAEIMED